MKGCSRLIKRSLDLLISIPLVLLLIPLAAPIMLLLACTGEHKVFYRQKRIGYQKKPFEIWKFATMLQNSPNLGAGSLTLKNDPRVTTVGKYLRKSKINELPQLINVITGDMSLVGPRPQMLVDFEAYSPEVQDRIYEVKPGITGIGSIVFRDEEKLLSVSGRDVRQFYIDHIAPYKGALEMWYQAHSSLSTDLKLIFLTVWVILFPTSTLYFRIFKDLPKMPIAIQNT